MPLCVSVVRVDIIMRVEVCVDGGVCVMCVVFFFKDTATTEIYTRSLVGSVRCV